MSDEKVYPVNDDFAAGALINSEQYDEMYARSVENPDEFWAEQAEQHIDWFSGWDKVQEWDYNKAEIAWFKNAKLNVAYNCLDRHLETRGDQTAIIWERRQKMNIPRS